jgi:hypothetical protein
MVGIAENVGHALCYRILTPEGHILSCSELRPVDENSPNKRADLLSGEELSPPQNFIHSIR